MRTATPLILLTALVIAPTQACNEAPGRAELTPKEQFVLEEIRFSETLDDGTQWVGRANRAEGSLEDAVFEHVELDVTTADSKKYWIRSPRARLNFDSRRGVFENMILTDEAGATLRAGKGDYYGVDGKLDASGPVRFDAEGVRVDAARGSVDLNEGSVLIEGPVQGTYHKSAQAIR